MEGFPYVRTCFWGSLSSCNRFTLQSSEVHQSLVVAVRSLRGEQRLGQGGKLFLAFGGIDGCENAEVTGKNTIDIAIDYGHGTMESNGGNGSGGVVAHPFELSDFLESVGKRTSMGNLSSSGVQVSGPAVVAQSLPKAQHFVFGGCG